MTKKDLLEVSKIPADKIQVIYEGPTADFKYLKSDSNRLQGDALEADEVRRFREKYNLPEKFVLAIGGVGERRNLIRIKEACRDYNLVIAGQTLPWLGIDELELLYASAEALLYCSLYEGFGIPILDAFACGLPVITSNVSAMPEIGGEAVIYVDPYKAEDIKEKLDMVMGDKKLRDSLMRKGFRRVKQFSWEKAAEETIRVYRRLME